jgi:hypothetical protein
MMEQRQPLQQILLGKVVICPQKTDTRSFLLPCTSINSKWIKDLNIRPETLKLVQERAGNTLEVIDIGKGFLNRTLAAQATKRKDGQMGLHKIKKLLHNKRNGL